MPRARLTGPGPEALSAFRGILETFTGSSDKKEAEARFQSLIIVCTGKRFADFWYATRQLCRLMWSTLMSGDAVFQACLLETSKV